MTGPCRDAPGQLTCPSTPLRVLLLRAYDLESYQLVCPFPIDRPYEITAKIPPGSSKEQVNLMLQNLLAERFGVTVHRETRNLPIYELVVAKGGSKLKVPEKPQNGQPAADPSGRPTTVLDKDVLPVLPPGIPGMRNVGGPPNGGPLSIRISARMQSLDALLRMMKNEIGRPVVDTTGLTGVYDFTLTFAPGRVIPGGRNGGPEPNTQTDTALNLASEPGPPNVFAAFASQLGLNLEPRTGPVEVVVVDRLNSTPTEN